MKKIISLLLTLTLILSSASLLVACKKDAPAKTITVGYTDYAPMNYTDENGELVAYSELEQIFVDNGFVRIDTTLTFEDEETSSYLAYEVDFNKLSYVIMD